MPIVEVAEEKLQRILMQHQASSLGAKCKSFVIITTVVYLDYLQISDELALKCVANMILYANVRVPRGWETTLQNFGN